MFIIIIIIKHTFLSHQINVSYHEDVCSENSPDKKNKIEHKFQRL